MTYIFHRLSVEIEGEYVCVCVCDMVQYLNFVYALFFFLPVRFSEAVYFKSISNQEIVFH